MNINACFETACCQQKQINQSQCSLHWSGIKLQNKITIAIIRTGSCIANAILPRLNIHQVYEGHLIKSYLVQMDVVLIWGHLHKTTVVKVTAWNSCLSCLMFCERVCFIRVTRFHYQHKMPGLPLHNLSPLELTHFSKSRGDVQSQWHSESD